MGHKEPNQNITSIASKCHCVMALYAFGFSTSCEISVICLRSVPVSSYSAWIAHTIKCRCIFMRYGPINLNRINVATSRWEFFHILGWVSTVFRGRLGSSSKNYYHVNRVEIKTILFSTWKNSLTLCLIKGFWWDIEAINAHYKNRNKQNANVCWVRTF